MVVGKQTRGAREGAEADAAALGAFVVLGWEARAYHFGGGALGGAAGSAGDKLSTIASLATALEALAASDAETFAARPGRADALSGLSRSGEGGWGPATGSAVSAGTGCPTRV